MFDFGLPLAFRVIMAFNYYVLFLLFACSFSFTNNRNNLIVTNCPDTCPVLRKGNTALEFIQFVGCDVK